MPDRDRRRFLTGAGLSLPLLAASAVESAAAQKQAQPKGFAELPSNPLNARSFGAEGDGRHDDTLAVQAAIDSAARESGGTISFPPGVYSVRTLDLRSKVHLAGSGMESTILRLRDAAHSDLLRTEDCLKLAGTGGTSGPYNWSVRDMTLDGNRARNRSGSGLKIYGWGFLLQNLRIRQCAQAGIDSEWSSGDPPETPDGLGTPGDSMEAQVLNVKVHDCSAGGILWRGPHDSQFVNCVIYGTRTIGLHFKSGEGHSATGCQALNCHVWGHHEYGYKVEAGFVTLTNCMAEWASAAQLHVNEGDATVSAGLFFGSPKSKHVGIEIGSPDKIIYGSSVSARMVDLPGGAFKFTNEGGSGKIKALIYQTSGVPYTGRPSRGTQLELLVNGIDDGSATWLPRGSLGWNGGTPIVRHLSAVVDWEPARIPPGSTTWTKVPIDGASVGDTVAVGFSQPVPPGAILAGSVIAPGLAAVTLLNATNQPLRLARGQLRADCWVH